MIHKPSKSTREWTVGFYSLVLVHFYTASPHCLYGMVDSCMGVRYCLWHLLPASWLADILLAAGPVCQQWSCCILAYLFVLLSCHGIHSVFKATSYHVLYVVDQGGGFRLC